MRLDRRLSRVLVREHPGDAARVLEGLSPDDAAATLAELPAELAARAVGLMEPSSAAACLQRGPRASVGAVLRELSAITAAGIVMRLEGQDRERLLAGLSSEVADPIVRMVRHPPGTAGALMDAGVLALPEDLTAGEARNRVQRRPRRVQYYLYVTDREQRVVGVVNLRELMLAPATRPLAALMKRPVTTLSVHARRRAILGHPGWREFHALPVVDGSGVLLGALRYETLRQLETEAGAGGQTGPLAIGLALSEVYTAAATALLQGILDTIGSRASDATKEKIDER